QLRRKRCQMLRNYLNNLSTDFACVCMAVKIIMLQAHVDRPDLAATLLQSQLRFALGLISVHVQLRLHELGVGTIQTESMLNVFNGMFVELRSLVPSSAVWGS